MNDFTPSRLVRALGPLTATAIVVGTVIGSGVFKKPQKVAETVPDFSWAMLAWVLGGLLAILGGLALAEVAVLYPKAGGNYVFLREGYGRFAGFLWGWVEFWIIRAGSIAALATIFGESLCDLLKPHDIVVGFWGRKYLTTAVILGLALLNVRGVRWGGLLQLVLTLVKVGSLLVIFALPFVAAALAWPTEPRPTDPADIKPPTSITLGGFGLAVFATLWAYHGWMNIAPVAEEVKSPQRNIPLALLTGIGVVTALYLGANFAYYQALSHDEIANVKSTTVATAFSQTLLGPAGAVAASAAVMISVFGALNGNLLVGPRLLYAMGEDGLAPRALASVHERYRTPALAILVLAGWSILLILGVALGTQLEILPSGKSHFDILTDFAMFGAVIFETLAVASIFVFRRRLPEAPRPYRCPLYPVVPAVYVILLAIVAVVQFYYEVIYSLIGLGFIGLGAVVYWVVFHRPGGRVPAEPEKVG